MREMEGHDARNIKENGTVSESTRVSDVIVRIQL